MNPVDPVIKTGQPADLFHQFYNCVNHSKRPCCNPAGKNGFAPIRRAPASKNRLSVSTPDACIFFVAWRTLSVHNDSSIG